MPPISQQQAQFDQFCDQVELHLDGVVVDGSDQELFVASYLHGHFSLVVSQQLQQQALCLEQLQNRMTESLQQAFGDGELQAEDQQQVQGLWQALYHLYR